MPIDELEKRIDTIEDTYELMLGYAAQGLEGDEASKTGGQLRAAMKASEEAIAGIAAAFRSVVAAKELEPAPEFETFIDVLEQDALRALAGLRLTLAQPSISSQLVDNLNASLHLRTLLTDVFLVDEIIKKRLAKKG